MRPTKDGYSNLAMAILTVFKNENGREVIRFSDSRLARELCDYMELDYSVYREWAHKKGREMDLPP